MQRQMLCLFSHVFHVYLISDGQTTASSVAGAAAAVVPGLHYLMII